jgi:hypothetical protein
MRTPFGNAISIALGPVSIVWGGCDHSGSDGIKNGHLSPLTSSTTPIPSQTKSTGSDTLAAAAASFHAERQ